MSKTSDNLTTLLTLVRENPDLPVVPMVEAEVVGDDWGRWIGKIGDVRIDEYLLTKYQVLFKSMDDAWDVLERWQMDYPDFGEIPDGEMEQNLLYESLPWVKAIIVNIDERVVEKEKK